MVVEGVMVVMEEMLFEGRKKWCLWKELEGIEFVDYGIYRVGGRNCSSIVYLINIYRIDWKMY